MDLDTICQKLPLKVVLKEPHPNGYAKAQSTLGEMYSEGKGVAQDYGKAMKWFRKAAEQGHAQAQNAIGRLYYHGKGVSQDYAEAKKWFLKAAENEIVGFQVGCLLISNGYVFQAYAQCTLGEMYSEGRGVPQDYQEAAKWYQTAAENNNAEAQLYLGVKYSEGKGVPKDYVQAYMWLDLAAGQGQQGAVDARDRLARKMTSSQIEGAQRLAEEWKRKTGLGVDSVDTSRHIRDDHFKKGKYEQEILKYTKVIELDPRCAEAYYNRGIAYLEKGEIDLAIQDYTKVIELNLKDAGAYNNRGYAYREKGEDDLAIQDYTKAIEINPSYASAYYNRGCAYRDKRQYQQAFRDLTKAIELNPWHSKAYNNLAAIYLDTGKHDLAISHCNKAIEPLIKQLAAANPCAARKASFSFFTTQSFPGSSSS